jgi:hypothetical protein
VHFCWLFWWLTHVPWWSFLCCSWPVLLLLVLAVVLCLVPGMVLMLLLLFLPGGVRQAGREPEPRGMAGQDDGEYMMGQGCAQDLAWTYQEPGAQGMLGEVLLLGVPQAWLSDLSQHVADVCSYDMLTTAAALLCPTPCRWALWTAATMRVMRGTRTGHPNSQPCGPPGPCLRSIGCRGGAAPYLTGRCSCRQVQQDSQPAGRSRVQPSRHDAVCRLMPAGRAQCPVWLLVSTPWHSGKGSHRQTASVE